MGYPQMAVGVWLFSWDNPPCRDKDFCLEINQTPQCEVNLAHIQASCLLQPHFGIALECATLFSHPPTPQGKVVAGCLSPWGGCSAAQGKTSAHIYVSILSRSY